MRDGKLNGSRNTTQRNSKTDDKKKAYEVSWRLSLKQNKLKHESLILAQDERWRRA